MVLLRIKRNMLLPLVVMEDDQGDQGVVVSFFAAEKMEADLAYNSMIQLEMFVQFDL